ncbi:MAG: sensor histidine kinase [Clostridia bacterium]
MFKKLKNKLLIVNIIMIAALILGSFSVIYITTAHNVQRDITIRLDRILDKAVPKAVPDLKADRQPRVMKNSPAENTPQRPDNFEPNISFTVTADKDGNITDTDLSFSLSDNFYEEQISSIISGESDTGTIKGSDRYWKYKRIELPEKYIVAFTDTSVEHNILFHLILILLFVGLTALTVVFLISLYNANRSIKPIEESYNKQKQFVADASHELKTPLTTINTNIDVLLSHGDSTIDDEKKWLFYIKSEAERMTKLTNDLLYLARLDYDDNNIVFDKISFSDVIENVILTMEAVVFEKNIKLYYDITPDIYVYSSPEQLKQLVMILLDNAIKYTPQGGDIIIKLVHEAKAPYTVLTVRNTGQGIEEKDIKQIFERFYRSDKSRSRNSGGYGLGLAIAKAIAEASKGTISAESKKDEYTLFTVKFPAAK